MRVGILGFGLIGGSIARALHERASGEWSVVAWSPSGSGPRSAAERAEVVVAATGAAEAIREAQLIVLAAPPLECLTLLDELASGSLGPMRADAVVTDVASTKRRIVERAGSSGLRFVGGHPMAGVERSGYESATSELFVDRPWVVCPADDADAVARVEQLARATGARPVLLDPDAHDRAVAAISHLPLVTSVALVEAVLDSGHASAEQRAVIRALAASGWRDMTRLARGDVDMGAGIVVTNADELAVQVRELRDALDGWLSELERPGDKDPEHIRSRLADARTLLETDQAASATS
jgi:prephenate dehydrogenase